MLNSRYLQKPEPRLNIIPMIDIMMFLLVFFVLIVLKMIPASGLALHLPSASSATPLPHKSVVISIAKNGGLHYRHHVVTPQVLLQELKAIKHGHRVSVILAGDKAVSLDHLVKAMNVVREAGIENVGIATKH